jgi:hypothetical protein
MTLTAPEQIDLHLNIYRSFLQMHARFLAAPHEVALEQLLSAIDASLESYRAFWLAESERCAVHLADGLGFETGRWLETISLSIDRITEMQRLFLYHLAVFAAAPMLEKPS